MARRDDAWTAVRRMIEDGVLRFPHSQSVDLREIDKATRGRHGKIMSLDALLGFDLKDGLIACLTRDIAFHYGDLPIKLRVEYERHPFSTVIEVYNDEKVLVGEVDLKDIDVVVHFVQKDLYPTIRQRVLAIIEPLIEKEDPEDDDEVD